MGFILLMRLVMFMFGVVSFFMYCLFWWIYLIGVWLLCFVMIVLVWWEIGFNGLLCRLFLFMMGIYLFNRLISRWVIWVFVCLCRLSKRILWWDKIVCLILGSMVLLKFRMFLNIFFFVWSFWIRFCCSFFLMEWDL